jgi:hypothetical protein
MIEVHIEARSVLKLHERSTERKSFVFWPARYVNMTLNTEHDA